MCIWACCALCRPQQLRRSVQTHALQDGTMYLVIFSVTSDLAVESPKEPQLGDLRLDSCVHQPVQGQVCSVTCTSQRTYRQMQLPGQFPTSPIFHTNGCWASSSQSTQVQPSYTPVDAVA